MLLGRYDLSIDHRGRVPIPTALLAQINKKVFGDAFYVTLATQGGTLVLYPSRYYERLQAMAPPNEKLSEEAQRMRRYLLAHTFPITVDAQNRVLLPDVLLKDAQIGQKATLTGMRDSIEVWDRTRFTSFSDEMKDGYTERRKRVDNELNESAIRENLLQQMLIEAGALTESSATAEDDTE